MNICALAQIIGIFLSGVIIIIMAPVENYNNPLDATELLYYKKKEKQPVKLKFIPYYTWANRGENEMEVWVRI